MPLQLAPVGVHWQGLQVRVSVMPLNTSWEMVKGAGQLGLPVL